MQSLYLIMYVCHSVRFIYVSPTGFSVIKSATDSNGTKDEGSRLGASDYIAIGKLLNVVAKKRTQFLSIKPSYSVKIGKIKPFKSRARPFLDVKFSFFTFEFKRWLMCITRFRTSIPSQCNKHKILHRTNLLFVEGSYSQSIRQRSFLPQS